MARPSLNDLDVFIVVGREGNFTRAASKLGVSPSAVSQTIRGLEERLGVRLLTRTTRSVNLTQAGERLLTSVAPMLEQIEAQLADLSSSFALFSGVQAAAFKEPGSSRRRFCRPWLP
ncbi:hypothetical protein BO221_50830 [Archangium sp. Cb G35]|uniref:LysR family transcriptional regulator n=1 Tax=Archangium sp. Cb G35 TaxID=1920190 RepID=UPI0009666691|nr:hypothetical protein BO221_50830 [Archangium sp. Cb G35]